MALTTLRDGTAGRGDHGTGRLALLGFIAGVVSVLVFHQGTVWLLNQAGVLPNGPFRLTPIAPFGVPQIVNQAFWGGLWGILIAFLLPRVRIPDLMFCALFGMVALTFVNWVVLPAIRGTPYFAGGVPARMWPSLLIAAAFGWGVALILREMRRRA